MVAAVDILLLMGLSFSYRLVHLAQGYASLGMLGQVKLIQSH